MFFTSTAAVHHFSACKLNGTPVGPATQVRASSMLV